MTCWRRWSRSSSSIRSTPRMRACRMTLSMAQGRDSPVRRRSVRAARSRSRTNSVAPTSVPAPQLAAALPQLRGVIASHLFGGSRVVLHAGVAAIAAAVSRPAEIIGEIKVVSVVAGDAERVGSLRMIPADEIDGVGETAAPRRPVAGFHLILRPGAVQRLRVAGSAGDMLPGNEAEQLGARWSGVALEAGFLAHRRHQHRNGNAVFLLGTLGSGLPVVKPAVILVEDGADIVDMAGRRRAGRKRQQHTDSDNFTKTRPTHRKTNRLKS